MKTSPRFIRAFMALFALVIMSSVASAADPGLAFPASSEGSDDKAGSILIYNIYTSSPSSPSQQNTRFSITNTSSTSGIAVHLFFVDGTTCSIADRYICLTASQTATFLASEQDPGTTGYLIAIASTLDGLPAQFNFLIGDEYVKFETGHFASLGAEAYSKLTDTNVVSTDGSLAAVFFDGVLLAGSYNRLSRVVAVDNIGSRADGNDTLLILNRIGGSLVTGAATLGSLFGLLYNDAEEPHSFNLSGGCQLRSALGNNFPRTTPRFETVIPAGQTGWMKIYSVSDLAITGSVINFNANARVASGSFSEGHNLHKLRLTAAANLVIPLFPPSC
jgi:hypothetical protein